MKKFWVLKIAFFVIAGFLLMTLVVMSLWNWLVPALFNGPVLSLLQAGGLLVLTRLLFRGLVPMKGGRHGCRKPGWENWKDKMDRMSPEERERMRALWRQRCKWTGTEKTSYPGSGDPA